MNTAAFFRYFRLVPEAAVQSIFLNGRSVRFSDLETINFPPY